MKLNSKSGSTLAAAAATLFLAGAVVSTASTSANAAGVKCVGTNACKGQSACKGAENSCKGLNACKTTGISMATSEAGGEAKGRSVPDFLYAQLEARGAEATPGPHPYWDARRRP